jgi:hypothetical protein
MHSMVFEILATTILSCCPGTGYRGTGVPAPQHNLGTRYPGIHTRIPTAPTSHTLFTGIPVTVIAYFRGGYRHPVSGYGYKNYLGSGMKEKQHLEFPFPFHPTLPFLPSLSLPSLLTAFPFSTHSLPYSSLSFSNRCFNDFEERSGGEEQ